MLNISFVYCVFGWVFSSENMDKLLSDFAINNGTRLKCDDFLQNLELVVIIAHVWVQLKYLVTTVNLAYNVPVGTSIFCPLYTKSVLCCMPNYRTCTLYFKFVSVPVPPCDWKLKERVGTKFSDVKKCFWFLCRMTYYTVRFFHILIDFHYFSRRYTSARRSML